MKQKTQKEIRQILDRTPGLSEEQKRLTLERCLTVTAYEWQLMEEMNEYSKRFIDFDHPVSELDILKAQLQTYSDFMDQGRIRADYRSACLLRMQAIRQKIEVLETLQSLKGVVWCSI